jgi:hypothetical protein
VPKSNPSPSTPAKPGIKVKPVKDLEPDESQIENVRGGQAMVGRRFSDATVKSKIMPFTGALTKLRELYIPTRAIG